MKFYEFDIPAAINGEQLKAELGCQEVYIANDKLIIGGDLSQTETAKGVAAHKPKAVTPPTLSEKLVSIGLSLDELKAALSV